MDGCKPDREKLSGVHLPVGSDEGSSYSEWRKSSSTEHQMGALRGKNPCSRVGDSEWGNFTTKGFDSCRMAEK